MRANSSYYRLSGLLLLGGLAAVYGQNTVTVSPSPVILNVGPNDGPTSVAVTVTNTQAGTAARLGQPAVPWLFISTNVINLPGTFNLTVNPAGLAVGVYYTTLQLDSGVLTNLPVIMTISSGSSLSVNPSYLIFGFATGGATPATRSFAVNAPTAVSYSVSGGANWITVQTASGQAAPGSPGTVSIGVDPTAVNGPGTYVGAVTLSPSSGGSTLVPVVLQYTNTTQLFSADSPVVMSVPFSLENTIFQKTVAISATGVPISFQANANILSGAFGPQWLTVAPQSGSTPAALTLTVNTVSLPTGQYQASLDLAATDGSGAALSIPVTLIHNSPTTMDVSPTSLSFASTIGAAAPPHQSVTPTTSIPGQPYTVSVSANGNGAWLKAAGGGSTPAPVDVSVDPTGLTAGTYNGTITITVPGATNSPETVSVTLTVSNGPVLTSPNSGGLTFNYEIGFGAPPAQTVSVSSVLGDAVAFSIGTTQASTSNNVTWLLAGTPSSTVTPATFAVGANPQGMAAGKYTGSVVATTSSGSTLTIPVTLNVTNLGSPLAGANPSSLTFNIAPGNTTSPQMVTVTSTGEALAYSVSAAVNTPTGGTWLLASNPVAPAFAGTPSSFFVSVQSTGLPVGTYTGSVTVQPTNGNPAVTIPVTLNIATSTLTLSTNTLNFVRVFGGVPPPVQSVNLSSSGAPLSFTASVSGGSWLTVFPSSGITPASLAVSATGVGLLPGSYTAQILVNATGSTNGQQVVTVNLTVANP